MSKWFRFYSEALRNPKVAKLSDRDFRLWVSVLAVASENEGAVPPADELRHILKTRLDHLLTGLDRLISGGLIDRKGRAYEPHNWSKFQYKSDTSTERVRKHRGGGNVSGTPPDTEAETEQKIEPIAQQPEAATPRLLFDRLLEAAGIRGNPSPGLVSMAPMLGLLDAGYELEQVLEAIRSRPNPNVRSWGYYVPIVEEYVATRRGVAAKATPPQPVSSDQWGVCLEHWRSTGDWNRVALGPRPGEPNCRVPAHLLEQAA